MASKLPGAACCSGFKHEGTAQGTFGKIDGIHTYFSGEESNAKDRTLLIITDVYGCDFINTQLVADNFANAGYYVVVPDLFDGDSLDANKQHGPETFQTWLPKHQPQQVSPIVNKVYDHIKTKYDPKKIYSVGYCFGAKYVFHLLAEEGKITAGATAHPSFVTIDEVRAIKGPVLISAAETDSIYTVELRHETEKVLAEIGATYFTTLSSGVSHGFAIRGDITQPVVKAAKERAFDDALRWFSEF